jgi:flavorubredoxin
MNQFLAAAPQAVVAMGGTACLVSVNDLADRSPRPLGDGEVLDLGGKRVRYVSTPHVPHNWESGLLYEETTKTLLCGDLFTHLGDGPAITTGDILGPAIEAEQVFHASSMSPGTPAAIRNLAELAPERLAVMHGSSFEGDAAAALRDLADAYDRGFAAL